MAGDEVCDGSNMTVLLQNDTLPCDSLWIPTSSATLDGGKSIFNFEKSPSFFQPVKEENGDEDFDVCHMPPGKKRRLTSTQVQFLEKNYEVENKLEPDRKVQLAKELGLRPRQVAIWFQNRRARSKNKQLEKDYNSLKASYDKLKIDHDNLLKEQENLNTEFVSLKEKLFGREKGIENVELEIPIPNSAADNVPKATTVTQKQEDESSAKSDVFDSDSPRSFLDPADSCQALEPDQSDFSQDEEDDFSRSFLPQPYYSKLYHEPIMNTCNFEFPVEDQAFWTWSY